MCLHVTISFKVIIAFTKQMAMRPSLNGKTITFPNKLGLPSIAKKEKRV
jgi:hypothetical protein